MGVVYTTRTRIWVRLIAYRQERREQQERTSREQKRAGNLSGDPSTSVIQTMAPLPRLPGVEVVYMDTQRSVRPWSRRDFLGTLGSLSSAILVAACSPPSSPAAPSAADSKP